MKGHPMTRIFSMHDPTDPSRKQRRAAANQCHDALGQAPEPDEDEPTLPVLDEAEDLYGDYQDYVMGADGYVVRGEHSRCPDHGYRRVCPECDPFVWDRTSPARRVSKEEFARDEARRGS